MEKSEIIKNFLNKGVQITSNALNFFTETPEKLDTFLSKTTHYPSTITLDFIKEVLELAPRVQLIKASIKKGNLSVNDFVDYFNKRYIFLSSILNKRLDLVNLISINKISEKTKNFSIIGMIKEKFLEDKSIVIEDRSGEIRIILSETLLSQLVEDEIVGIVCEKTDSSICGKKVIFPDIPLQRVINKTKEEKNVFLISDIHMDSELFNKKSYEKLINWLEEQRTQIDIFILGDISSKKDDIMNFLSSIPKKHEVYIIKGEIDKDIDETFQPNPAFIQLENIKLFLFHNQKIEEYINLWNTPEQTIINLIKKRHLNPTFLPDYKIYDKDPYLLDIIPDIVVAAHVHTPSLTNYKGITIITTGSFITQPIFWLINLRTRETFKIDFS